LINVSTLDLLPHVSFVYVPYAAHDTYYILAKSMRCTNVNNKIAYHLAYDVEMDYENSVS